MATKRKAEPGTAGSAYRTMPLSCVQCGNTKTPQWREGPLGPKTLCNACGVKWLRQLKRVREEAAPTKVHGTRRVRLSPSSHRASSREPPTRSGMYLHGDSSDDAVWPADEEDEMAAASLLTFAGVAPPLPMHTAMEDDEQGGEDLHMHAAAGTGALAQPTGSLATNENDSAITFHLPIPKLEVQRAAAPHAPPPPHGAQLIITRRVAVRKPLVYAPLPSSFHVLSTTTAAHGADPAAEDHEDEHSELADENNNTNLVVQYEAAHQGQPANSRDSHQDVAPQQLAQPLATPAAARAPPTTEAVSAGPDASQLAELQAAVIAAFAELQAADAARIATLQYLAQTQEAADNARQQALECAERLLAELEGLNACQSGRKQPAVAAAVAANVTATAAASAPANLMAHAMAAALGHAASPMPLTGH